MKQHIGVTIDTGLLREIEDLRGREKRSTFIEHLLQMAIKAYKKEKAIIYKSNGTLWTPENISS